MEAFLGEILGTFILVLVGLQRERQRLTRRNSRQ